MNPVFKKILAYLEKRRHFRSARILARLLLGFKPPETGELPVILKLLGASETRKRIKKPSHQQSRIIDSFDTEKTITPQHPLRIAVCISGQPRSLAHCLPYIIRFFHGHNVTYFCHSWDNNDFPEMKALENCHLHQETPPDFTELEKLAIEFSGLKDFGNGIKVPYMSTNLFPMWYSVLQSYRMIETHGYQPDDFDLICRTRYDILWIKQFDLPKETFDGNTIVIDPGYNGYGGYGDQFSIGAPDNMKKYFSLFNWLEGFLKEKSNPSIMVPETLLRTYLDDICHLDVHQIDFGMRLVRDEFTGLEPHLIPMRSNQTSNRRNREISDYIRKKFPDIFNRY